MSIDQITSEALQLSLHDRAILVEVIWESLEEPFTLKTNISDKEAIALAKKRNNEIDNGKVKVLQHKELMNRLRDED